MSALNEENEGETLRQMLRELNFKQGEKVCVSPVGEVVGADGRTFSIDGEFVISSIQTHIPLYENHWEGRAYGWFDKNTTELRDDGIYMSLELNDDGQPLVENRNYRYLSPTFWMADNRVVIGIDSVGLVNTPNLLFKELNSKQKETHVDKETQEKLIKLEANIKTLEGEKTSLTTERDQLQTKLTELEANAKTLETNAQKLQAEKEAATAKADEAETKLKEANEKLAFFGKADLEENDRGADALSQIEQSIIKQLGISEDEFNQAKGV